MSSRREGDDNGGSKALPKEKRESPMDARRYQHRNGYQTLIAPRQPKFEGKCDKIKGHIYNCSNSHQLDLFTKTTKEIEEYVGRTYKYGGNMQLLVENLMLPCLVAPEDPPKGASRTEERIWATSMDEYVKQRNYLDENVKTLYSLVWRQCSDIMCQKIESLNNFKEMSSSSDRLGLL